MHITATVSTKGRTHTTLPLCLMAIVLQTRKPDKIIVFDDNEEMEDVRTDPQYQAIFRMMDIYGIQYQWIYGDKKGQHYNHDKANKMCLDVIWRVDDDEIPESNVLFILQAGLRPEVGAIGGIVCLDKSDMKRKGDNKIETIDGPNMQWYYDRTGSPIEVDHLYSSFLYRANKHDYNLSLSKVAHREETMFTYGLKKKGWKIIFTPDCVTLHLRQDTGGIRDGVIELFEHDEKIFRKWLWYVNSGEKLIVLNCGLGDHFMFRSILNDVKEKYGKITIACCYPEVFKDDGVQTISINEANEVENTDKYNVYHWCVENNWDNHLIDAYKKMYL